MSERPKMQFRMERLTTQRWAAGYPAGGGAGGNRNRQRRRCSYGTLTGTVTDKSGAVVPKVTVTLTNQGTGEVRAATANAVGEYRFGDVLPGTYTVAVAANRQFCGVQRERRRWSTSIAWCASISPCSRPA